VDAACERRGVPSIVFLSCKGARMAKRKTQQWPVRFTTQDHAMKQHTFFYDLPTVVVDVQRERIERRIRIDCLFYKANGTAFEHELPPENPSYVTTATGLKVTATPLDSSDPPVNEVVTAVWSLGPRRKRKTVPTPRRKGPVKKVSRKKAAPKRPRPKRSRARPTRRSKNR
jgi:hypothetical protein